MMQPIREVSGVDRARFEAEILPDGQPVVMRGLVTDWPVVHKARESDAALADYLKRFDTSGRPANVSLLPPQEKGRFFYAPDMRGYNFGADKRSVSGVLDWLLANGGRADMPTAYIQSLILKAYLPGFEAENPTPLLVRPPGARMWIGNRVRTQTHFDPSHNIACLVAGRRRFTLFPPEQIDNLYPAPFDTGPGGVAVSMAGIEEPDFETYPRLRAALATAQVTELEPGDAIYVPYAWWHHVQSLADFNILINTWWNDDEADWLPPNAALFTAIMALRDLSQDQKAIWKHIFDLYVFGDGAAVKHIPQHARSAFGDLTPEVRAKLKGLIKGYFGL